MKIAEIEKEQKLELLKAELKACYSEFDNETRPMAKTEIKRHINACENRINELKRRQRYLED